MTHPSLKDAAWLNTPAIRSLFAALLKEGDEVRAVGGAPRNHLLGTTVSDVDLATQLPPQEVIARAEAAGIKHIPTGIDHGTVTLVIDGHSFEVTSLREDIETDGRHAVVRFGTDWLEDARRRDFTINALYVSADGTLHDPLGTGLHDIRARRLCLHRGCGNPHKGRSSTQPALLSFCGPGTPTRHMIKRPSPPPSASVAGLRALSAERIHNELFKLLSAPDPRTALQALYQAGLLTTILATAPNITLADNLIAAEIAFKRQPDPLLRLAALAIWQEGDAARLGQRLRLSKKQQAILAKLARYPAFPAIDNEAAITAFRYRAGQELFPRLAMLAFARTNQAEAERWEKMISDASETPLPAFPLTGADLVAAGHKPGPELGQLLENLENCWLKSGLTLSREELLRRA